MLQWMGGSRRKVAASHTSVKKRQKQYFEQRRQQQHQLTGGSESCTNDRNNVNHHPREHQSLDILNLLNLSTTSPECKPSCPKDGMEDLDADFYIPKNITSGVGSPLNHKAEPMSSKRTSFSIPDIQTNDFKKANTTVDLMDGTERKLSVFDLVGDDHTITDLEECSPSEAHMAFSVEGLGKMNTETPNNSPQPSNRNFAYRCSSPWKDTGQPDTSNVREKLDDFEKEVDTIIESSKMFQDDSCYMSPVSIHAKDGGRKQKTRSFNDHLHKPYISNSRSYYADYNQSRVSDENEWNAKSAFLDDGEDSFYWTDQQSCREESLNLNFMNYGKDFTESRSSADHGAKKRDYLETTWRSNIEDSPVQIPHHLERTIEHPSYVKAAYFKSPENFDFDNVFDQPVRSSMVPEEDKDSLSLRSEESCSSSAVWGSETPISQFETNTRQRKREVNSFCNLEDKNYLNNDLSQESWENWEVDDQHLKRKVGSGKQVRLSNPGKLKSTSQKDSSFRGGLNASYNWFAEGFTSVGISSDITTERDKPYPFLNLELGSSQWRQYHAPYSTPKTWVPKFSIGGTGDDDDYDYVNSLSPNHKSKLSGDISGFESDTLSENENNEQSKEVNHPKNQGDETSSSVAKSLSDENECNLNKEVREVRHQGNRGSGEKTSRDSFQQTMMLEKRTLQFVCFNKTLLIGSLTT